MSPRGSPPTHLTVGALAAAGLPHGTTTRHCPAPPPGSPPFDAEARVVLATGAPVAFVRQVHGAAVAHAAAGGMLGAADAIVATAPGVPVAIVTADCLPIVLWDPAARVLAAAHVGWRGTVKEAPRAAVEALAALGAAPAGLLAAIGPSIGPCCYEVDAVVVDPLRAAFGPVDRWVAPRARGKWRLDLWAVNEARLVAAGVDPTNIHNARLCTACRADLFFSYRRGDRGRLVTLAMLPAAAATA